MTLKIFFGVMCVLVVASTTASCSLKSVPAQNGSLKIVLQDASTGSLLEKLSENVMGEGLSILTNPTQASDFNCFAANITGPGIAGSAEKLNNCTTTDGFHGHGAGVIAGPVSRGETIEVDVTAGADRSIEVFGIYPPAKECGNASSGTNSAYFLGGTKKTLSASTSVVIPINYSGATASLTCSNQNNGSYAFLMDGGGGTGQISGCMSAGGITASAPTPGSMPSPTTLSGSAAPTDLLHAQVDDGTLAFEEIGSCTTSQLVYVQYSFNLGATSISNRTSWSVLWKGRAGYHTGSCDGATGPTNTGGSVDIWNNNTSQWVNVGATTTVSGLLTGTFSPITDYVLANNVYVRVVAAGTTGTYCSTVQTDLVQLILN